MDFEFSEAESTGLDNEMSDILDLIGHKCSICFTEESETELSICGDQFCYSCLERTCGDCGHEQSILGEPIEESLPYLFETLEEMIPEGAYNILFRKMETHDLTGLLRHLSRQIAGNQTNTNLVYFLRKLLQESLSDETGLFANKQLAVVAICSKTFCDFCTARICVRCGQSDWHEGLSCLEYAKRRLESMDSEGSQSLAWQVAHGKQCPKCFLLVTKDDDGSCNQMRCSHCGYIYCWECLREWSSFCGYYQCSQTQQSDEVTKKSQKHRWSDRTEAGIPDVTKLPSFSPRQTIADYEENIRTLKALSAEISVASPETILSQCGLDEHHIIPFNTFTQPPKQATPVSSKSISLVHYGVEVRHLPLAGQLPGAPKFISTHSWVIARDELKFSRCFDRVCELRSINGWTANKNETAFPNPPKSNWDNLLEEMWFMQRDFEQENLWKRSMAKLLAKEASTLRKRKSIKDARLFYNSCREMLNEASLHLYGAGSGLVPNLPPVAPPSTISVNNCSSGPMPNVASYPSFPPAVEKRYPADWTLVEDSFLAMLLRTLPENSLKTISRILNSTFHNGRYVRFPVDVVQRWEDLPQHDHLSKHRAKRQLDRIALMNSSSTKLIATRPPIATKKLNMVAHPSHEAAARKANQNISKLLTPQELAMRRIQRTRIITDPSGTAAPNNGPNNTIARQHIAIPPGSPNQRPMNATAYQAAVSAASIARPGVPPQSAQSSPNVTGPNPRPGMMVPNAAITQQQRQALLNRSHQIGNYIASMHARPANSPLLRPPHSGEGAPSVAATFPLPAVSPSKAPLKNPKKSPK